ncbi:hypothetical protein ACYOEI_24385, partial [Singulisphaera rosea]
HPPETRAPGGHRGSLSGDAMSQALLEATSRINGERPRTSRIGFGAIVLAALGIAVVPVFLGVLNHDVAWYLHVAGRVLVGERLYADIIEINPPLIVWLSIPPTLVAHALGISEILTFRLMMIGVIAGSLSLSAWALHRALPEDPSLRRWALLFLVFVLVPLAGYDFGQREHMMLTLILPYVILASARARETTSDRGILPWVVGLVAGLGIALKPHFALAWIAVEIDLASIRRTWRVWLRPEAVAIVAVGTLYAVAVLALTPDYFALIRWAKGVYAASSRITVGSLLVEPATLLTAIAWLSFLASRPERTTRRDCEVLLVADLALLAVAFVQFKGFTYHFYPPLALAFMLLGWLWSECRGSKARDLVLGGLIASTVLGVAFFRVNESRFWRGRPGVSATALGRMVREAKTHASGGRVFTFSPSIAASFPMVTYAGVGWASRHSCLFFLPSFYPEVFTGKPIPGYHSIATMGKDERFLFESVVDDLLKGQPSVLFVDESPRKLAFNGQAFDFLAYYSLDPRFVTFLRDYEPAETIDIIRVYRRKPGVRRLRDPVPKPFFP